MNRKPDPSPRQYVVALLAAVAIGVPVAFAAVAFTSLVHAATQALWTDLPKDFGWDEPQWWYVLLLPMIGGLLTAGALLLPGKGGHSPAQGLSFEPHGPKLAASTILAAAAALIFGIVLGPEAPLVAIGLALGAVAGRLAKANEVMGAMVALAGGFAAISTVFGGPLASSLLLFEALATSGKFPSAMLPRILLPGLVAAGVGTLVFTGVADWSGVHEVKLALPGLPHYGTVKLVDIPIALLISIVTAAFTLGSRRLGSELFNRIGGKLLVLLAGGLLVGLIAVLFRAVADKPVDLILFSGETATPMVLAETSVAVLAGIVVCKALAYGISIGAGFRGGPVFPAVFLGVSVGVLASAIDGGLSVTAAVGAGVAAAASSALRAPFFGALLAALLVGSAGANAIPLIVLSSALAWLIATAVNPDKSPTPEVKQADAAPPQ